MASVVKYRRMSLLLSWKLERKAYEMESSFEKFIRSYDQFLWMIKKFSFFVF